MREGILENPRHRGELRRVPAGTGRGEKLALTPARQEKFSRRGFARSLRRGGTHARQRPPSPIGRFPSPIGWFPSPIGWERG